MLTRTTPNTDTFYAEAVSLTPENFSFYFDLKIGLSSCR